MPNEEIRQELITAVRSSNWDEMIGFQQESRNLLMVTGRNINAMEANKKDVRKMAMDSYRDIEKGKGRECKEFFAELESRYRNANV